MNESVVAVMHEAGKAINDTFHKNHAGITTTVAAPCTVGAVVINATAPFDFVMSMEDLSHGQRIGNYSIDYRLTSSQSWQTLVPPVYKHATPDIISGPRARARDQYVGHRRIDMPIVDSGSGTLAIEQVRFNCLRMTLAARQEDVVHLRQFSLHKKIVPWE